MRDTGLPVVRLDPFSIAQIADAVVERLTAHGMASEYLTAEQVARELNVSVGWVYAHKRELGAEPLGSGLKPRLRFPRASFESFRAATVAAVDPAAASPPAATPERTPRPIAPGELVPIRGRPR